MARFDVHAGPGDGYLLNLQSDILDDMTTSVVAPLVPAGGSPRKISRLHPVFQIDGAHYVLATHLMASVPNTVLARPPVDNLDRHHDEIVAALDMLFLGY